MTLVLILVVAGFLHLLFVAGEMFPWHHPLLLQRVSLKKKVVFGDDQLRLAATIVRNAGIYNLILAAGFFWSAFPDRVGLAADPPGVWALRCFFLTGAVVAGLFGVSVSPATLIQAAVGVLGLLFLR